MEKVNIRVLDNYELRPTKGGLDWQVWQYKAIEGGDRKGQQEWTALPSFHQTIGSALKWIMKRLPKECYANAQADLAGAVDELRAIADEVDKHAKRFEKAVSA